MFKDYKLFLMVKVSADEDIRGHVPRGLRRTMGRAIS